MPPIASSTMTPAQAEAAREIAGGRRGAVIGPFVPALRSPEFTRRLQRLGEYLRYESALAPPLRELAILVTARAWGQEFEWAVHAPLAREAGLSDDVLAAIADGRRPESLDAASSVLYDFLEELEQRRVVSDEAFERVRAAVGEQGVVDAIGIAGYYSMLAMLMNVARTPLPDGTVPVLRPRPGPV